MAIHISRRALEPNKPQTKNENASTQEIEELEEEEEHEQKSEVEEEPKIKTFLASDEVEKVKVIFATPKPMLKRLKETANIFGKPYGRLINEALEEHLRKLNDISYLKQVLVDDNVDSIINRLREHKINYLTPKALQKIHIFLKDKSTFSGLNKWVEFATKMRIDSDIDVANLDSVIYIEWQ